MQIGNDNKNQTVRSHFFFFFSLFSKSLSSIWLDPMICVQHKVMSHRWSMSIINVLVMKKKVFIRLSFFYSKLIYLNFLKKILIYLKFHIILIIILSQKKKDIIIRYYCISWKRWKRCVSCAWICISWFKLYIFFWQLNASISNEISIFMVTYIHCMPNWIKN